MTAQKPTNVRNATAATGGAGLAASPLAVWLAAIAAAKWSVPLELAGLIIAPAFAFVSGWIGRWAAKLNPND